MLASGSEDCTVKLWNLNSENSISGIPFLTLRGHYSPVLSLTGPSSFSVDNIKNRLYSGDIDGNIVAWTIPNMNLA